MKTKTLSLIAAAVAAATFASSSAFAAPSELFFSQSAGWVNPTTDASAQTGFFAGGTPPGWTFGMIGSPLSVPPYPTLTPTYSGMQWGNTFSKSDIKIASYDSAGSNAAFAPLNTGDGDAKWEENEYWVIDKLTQTNRVLAGTYVGNVWVADTLANLRIFDANPLTPEGPTQIFADPNSPVRITFRETANSGTEADPNCVGTTDGSNVTGTRPCNDIYNVMALDFAPLAFSYGGQMIELRFTLFAGPGTVVCTSNLDPGCANAVLNPGEFSVYTPENSPGTSEIMVAMAWRVPEPSMVALFGMGLLGLGLTARRRKAQA